MKTHRLCPTLIGLLANVFLVFSINAASTGRDALLTTPKTDENPQAAKPVILEGQRIQAMIDHAHDGDVLRIPPGVYVMDIPLKMEKKSDLTLLCKGVHFQTRDLMAPVFIIKDSENINIIDGHFQHLEPLGEYQCDGPVFSVINTKNIRFMGTQINGCGAVGIAASKTRNLLVFQCHLHHNTFSAITLSGCRDVDVFNNLFENNGQTYNASGCRHVRMQGNQVIQTGKGYWDTTEFQNVYKQFRDPLKEMPKENPGKEINIPE